MVIVLIRSIILYIAVLISLRVMGKGEIAEMNAFDLVITFLLAEVASIPMENNNIPIIYGIASITGLVFMQTFISYFALKSRRLSSFLSGKPAILINKGKIDYKVLKKERITIDEIFEQLRVQGFFSIKDVQYAILETDGNLSVIPSPNHDSNSSKEFKHLPISLIIDGQIINNSLKSVYKDKEWLFDILKSNNIDNYKDVLVCILDENDNIFIQRKDIN
ncbi:DUF421 domain-containing protein [Clostridium sp. CCUG 7971]|uniref:DUF421 domain-containing protein n=1 Tax=Clostridium sp. CCUG 7971 TaxID=2811414 RepID=UPI001ABB5651|nr:DUF421 domain-containing protein [Clostridium sp. CCUG 7971]MBO3443982.1 DUF421 domain-containing protein [Clostridium sp. CCUG 7971]